jgi:hypothetical protein
VHRGDVAERRVRAVVGAKDRVGAVRRFESSLKAGRSHRHVVTGLVARHAPPSVDAEVEKEWIGAGDDRKARDVDGGRATRLVVHGEHGFLGAVLVVSANGWCGRATDHDEDQTDSQASTPAGHHPPPWARRREPAAASSTNLVFWLPVDAPL